MTNSQKTSLLQALETMERHISDMRDTIASYAKDDQFSIRTCEAIATYAATLTGNVQERRGFCYALSILGFRVEWDGNHAVDITEV